jgi:hypothetical protein
VRYHLPQDQAVTDAVAQRLQRAALQAVNALLVVQRVNRGVRTVDDFVGQISSG